MAMVKSRSVIALSVAPGRGDVTNVDQIANIEACGSMATSSGISAASQISSSSWRTMLSTPPRDAGAPFSSLMKCTGTLTCTLLCSPRAGNRRAADDRSRGGIPRLGKRADCLAAYLDHDDRVEEVAGAEQLVQKLFLDVNQVGSLVVS